ncbi:MAG TPA: maleylpyruvate isomerase family mycothiol-dependent enzyme, partial [Mycobacteriales bacterium]|nr:maleylpyruvate isomerase family mycothiol-dependent enzyme [Mycobacteriales bacterium]
MPAVVAEQNGAGAAADDGAGRARRDWWVAAVRREGAEFAAAAAAADLDDDVPTCPGWTVRRLVSHLSRVHRSALNGVVDGTVEPPALAARPPDDGKLLGWYADGLARLLDVLADAEPHLPDFWPRRMAHETTMHRFDAELAAHGKGGGFDPALAADGVGEVLESMLGLRAGDEPLASARGDVLVHCTDTGQRWLVGLEPGVVRATLTETAPRRYDARLAGPAADLYLV